MLLGWPVPVRALKWFAPDRLDFERFAKSIWLPLINCSWRYLLNLDVIVPDWLNFECPGLAELWRDFSNRPDCPRRTAFEEIHRISTRLPQFGWTLRRFLSMTAPDWLHLITTCWESFCSTESLNNMSVWYDCPPESLDFSTWRD